ncbi:glycoside hydrolase family 31 protein [Eremomyces bilateralis CBS 781.70]|uniref:alpha-glucosidase n=1 Tax=Eremomyces bilateralis CBS 781.70 TaxID=1392243 RepID=A0A6G1GI20_9PEZI|nr:glycoside hydrolase family 31 protein [Eremomyces bilateralis CBS 781.70]KAF1817541.1 glycoside hydrolase family 31 protein [Eremomyces bilateralis CBS 781.70]
MNSLSPFTRGWASFVPFIVLLFYCFTPVLTVKHENFKTCDQSGFCKRNRAYADTAEASSNWDSPYNLDPATISLSNGQLTGTVVKTISRTGDSVRLPLTVTFLESGTARVTIDEEKRQKGDIVLRHGSKARKERYNEAERWTITGGLTPNKGAALSSDIQHGATKVHFGPEGKFEAIITHAPFSLDFRRDGTSHILFNSRGLMNVEHWRTKQEAPPEGESSAAEADPAVPPEDESTWWDESFGGNTDSKPRGPESVGLDITFSGYEHVYGIPEHASSMSLKQTRGGDGNYKEPYRMYNSDVFEYELDSPMTLYGAIPFMQAHRKDSTVGVFWLNAAETWVDIVKSRPAVNPLALGVKSTTTTQTHWFSESGLLDVFVFLGPSPQKVVQAYSELTGYSQLPQSFAIGYHQCRWNYVSDEDVMDVARKFDKHNIPFDVLWLDIEYTHEKKYFTFDPMTFPNPQKMTSHLDKHDRKLVAIIDPHIKNVDSYPVVDDLKKKQLAVNNKDGNIYEGWCWPGSSHWVDCFNPAAISWWKGLFKYDKFVGSSPNTFIWNDMNEPSVFNGPETTMPKDNLHHGNWEHRDVHNINGLTFHNATYEALLERKKGEVRRPFVLTRAFSAGSQRVGPMWTGDNQAHWGHLAASIPMTLNNGISGYPFAGADVGGFFGNPSKELLTRWYQAGAFYPFFRAHAHIDTRRREPYVAGSPYTEIMAQALRLRYSLLPAWYTAFREASVAGTPIVRPNFFVHPSDENGFAIDDQLYLGSTGLLAKPVVTEGAESVDIYLGDDETYYDYFDYAIYSGKGYKTVPAPLEKIPLLMQGGHIIPRRDRPRRSSGLMKFDPITLVVVLGKSGDAEGSLYLDDGETFDYQQGAHIHRTFRYEASTGLLTSEDISDRGSKTASYLKSMSHVRVERIVVVGAPSDWKNKESVIISEEGEKESGSRQRSELQFHSGQGGKAAWAVVKDPGLYITKGWKVDFS